MRKIVVWVVFLGILAAAGYGGYGYWAGRRDAGGQKQMPPPSVNAVVAAERPINPTASFVAKIEAKDKVGLRARVTGFLHERRFTEGDFVRKGDVLFVIEKVNFEAGLRAAEANHARAAANAKNAAVQYERAQKLYKTKDVSEARLDEAQAAYEASRADVAQMKAQVDLARQNLDYTEIVAPMDGKIGEARYSVGNLIGPDSGDLATLVVVDPIYAVFAVSENQVGPMQESFARASDVVVRFVFSDGGVYPEPGTIDFVDVTLDEAMNTLKMRAAFPNPKGRLIIGQYGRAVLTARTPAKAIVLPQRAVQQDADGRYAYVVAAGGAVERRAVKTGSELPGFEIVVADGLKAGDVVVTDGFQKIMSGAVVRVVQE
ncbi:MAG: efflux RND transporter periplasmic adaptor subunit [Alphaproteobacteria bacterium]|nr:efflux RND transporter periplasmic adaptor subunit [Alphaproteobacteria bacterium]